MMSRDTITASEPATQRSCLPSGVERHGKALRVTFRYEGKRRREIVCRDRVDEISIAVAARVRGQVLEAIAKGQFDYRVFFPDSRYAKSLNQKLMAAKGQANLLSTMTVREGVMQWLETERGGKAKSTTVNYTSRAKHVLDAFGDKLLAEVKTQELKQFRNRLVRSRDNPQGLSPKTANDVLTVIRAVWTDAFHNGITTQNRAAGVINHQLTQESHADPFTLEEMHLILNGVTDERRTARMVVLNCWLGLSRSELIALAAEDIDLLRKKLKVNRAQVHGEHKSPKVKARQREIDLLDPAIELLEEILDDHEHHYKQSLEITALDNLSLRQETVHLLFTNPHTGKPWSQSALDRWFKAHTKAVGVRYRGLNQCRHTFASRALSNFAPREWVIKQLGHIDDQMLEKHYGQWIPEETGLPLSRIDAINEAMCAGWARRGWAGTELLSPGTHTPHIYSAYSAP